MKAGRMFVVGLLAVLVAALLALIAVGVAADEPKEPIVVDKSGATKFCGVIVGGGTVPLPPPPPPAPPPVPPDTADADAGAEKFKAALEQWPGWQNNADITLLTQKAGNNSRDKIKEAIDAAKAKCKKGNEFLFYFTGHGKGVADDPDVPDEPVVAGQPRTDEAIAVGPKDKDGNPTERITDDELAEWLSGFEWSVTITVILEGCYVGGFVDGNDDLRKIEAEPPPGGGLTGPVLDSKHLRILMATDGGFEEGKLANFKKQPGGWEGGLYTEHLVDGLKEGKNLDGTGTGSPAASDQDRRGDNTKTTSSELHGHAARKVTEEKPEQKPLEFVPPDTVGGITELLVGGSDAPGSAANSSGASSFPYAALAGGLAAVVLALTAGAWYARRRWGR